MELIKKVQKETTKHLDKLEDNKDKSHVNYEVSQQTVNIPDVAGVCLGGY